VDGQLASAHNLPALYISPLLYPNKPVNTEPLSVTVPVIIGTGTVLVGTVSILVPPQHHLFSLLKHNSMYVQIKLSIVNFFEYIQSYRFYSCLKLKKSQVFFLAKFNLGSTILVGHMTYEYRYWEVAKALGNNTRRSYNLRVTHC